ncbi:MAG: polysaccharide pyruvyl transferase family protein [Elusimicrobia bacterium]|nr:polysaccharide pyruvyl transferase family protein [Elusimicrobiota bacterium]
MAFPSRCKPMIAIAGYFGRGNFGDDWLYQAFLHELRLDLWNTEGLIFGPESAVIPCWRAWVSPFREKPDQTVFLGGLFQDLTSRRSPFYYAAAAAWAKKRTKDRVIFSGAGLGPWRSGISREALIWIMRDFAQDQTIFYLRDRYSSALLDELGLGHLGALRPDPSWGVPIPQAIGAGTADRPGFGLALNGSLKSDELIEDLVRLLRVGPRQEFFTLFLSHPAKDQWQALEIMRRLGRPLKTVLYLGDIDRFLNSLTACNAIMSLRLHPVIAAAKRGIPVASFEPRPSGRGVLNKIRTLIMPDSYGINWLSGWSEALDWVHAEATLYL